MQARSYSCARLLVALLLIASSDRASAQGVTLQEGTATFSQTFLGTTSPDQVIDGDFGTSNGWAVLVNGTPATSAQTAAWETACDHVPGTLTFTMHFLHFNPGHLLGRLRLSVTTDDRSTFCDGLDTGGDVSANWVVLANPVVVAPTGMTSSVLPDGSLLFGGAIPATGVYTLAFPQLLSGVTGIRLEVLEDPSLPFGGPGLHPANGNFLLTEMEVDCDCYPLPEAYCTAGTSSSGCTAQLAATGTASATAAAGFDLVAAGVEGGKDGLFFFGTNGRQANPWGNGTSYQCVVPPVKRAGLLNAVGTPGLCNGSFSQDLNALWTAKPAKNPGAGSVVQAQLWYRDPFNTSNQTTSLSDALEFCVAP